MNAEQANAFLDAEDAPAAPAVQSAAPAVAAPAPAAQPVYPGFQGREPFSHYVGRSPFVQDLAQDVRANASDMISGAGTALRFAHTVATLPDRAARYMFDRTTVDPAVGAVRQASSFVRENAPVVMQAARNAIGSVTTPVRNWFANRIAPPGAPERVRVKSPSGQIGTISGWAVDDAKKAGYEVIE